MIQEMPKVFGEVLGGGVALRRLLGQGLQADGFEVSIYVGPEARGWLGVAVGDPGQRVDDVLVAERMPAGEQFVQDHSQRVQVEPVRELGSTDRGFYRGFTAVGKTLSNVKEFAALVRLCERTGSLERLSEMHPPGWEKRMQTTWGGDWYPHKRKAQ